MMKDYWNGERPEEAALRRRLRIEGILETIGAVIAALLGVAVAYIACLAF